MGSRSGTCPVGLISTIVDLTDPVQATIVSELDGSAGDVQVKGDDAYLCGGAGIRVVNIWDEANPSLIKTIPLKGYNRPWRAMSPTPRT
jgi:hypothetical protein